MSQHDYVIADAAGAAFLADLNLALPALASLNSGATAPATTYAYMLWADTTSGWLKQRDAANAAWILRMPLGTGAAVDVASATTLDLTANTASSATLRITGTTTTTAITLADGQQRLLRAAAAWPITHGASLICPGSTSYTCAAGDLILAIGEATGVVRLMIWKADGTPVVSSSAAVVGTTSNLIVKSNVTNPNYQADITADEIVVKSGSAAMLLSSVSVTVDITVSGAGGLDTGAEASATWYNLWAIAKADGTKAALLSTSSTAPTMPSGYTYKALIGAIYNDGSSNFLPFWQSGRSVVLRDQQIFTGQAGVASYTSQSIAAGVPPIAKWAVGNMGATATNNRLWAIAADANGLGAVRGTCYTTAVSMDSFVAADNFRVPLATAQTLYWKIDAASGSFRLTITGFEF